VGNTSIKSQQSAIDECPRREGGIARGIGGTSADSGKDQFADAVSAAPVHFDASQVCLPAQPVDATDTTFPASHDRTTLLVRSRDLSLRLAPVTQGFPLLWCNTSEERCVDRIEYIQIGNDSARDGGGA